MAAVVLMVAQPLLRNQLGCAVRRQQDASHRAAGRQLFHVGPLGRHQRLRRGQAGRGRAWPRRLATRTRRRYFTLLRFSRAQRWPAARSPTCSSSRSMRDFSDNAGEGARSAASLGNGRRTADALRGHRSPAAQGPTTKTASSTWSPTFAPTNGRSPTALAKSLKRLDELGRTASPGQLRRPVGRTWPLPRCGPVPGTRAAGVPLLVEVSVRNFGQRRQAASVRFAWKRTAMPGRRSSFEEIPPGKTVDAAISRCCSPRRASTRSRPGWRATRSTADNVRSLVIDVPQGRSTCWSIDGDAKGQDAFFLATALAPGGKITSGLKPQIETAALPARSSARSVRNDLSAQHRAARAAEIAASKTYVKAGGGVAIFMGELSRAEFFNAQLYRDGQGLFPLPLAGPAELVVDRLEKSPDLEVDDHPIFSVFAGERNSFFSTVVDRTATSPPRKDWSPDPDSTTKVIARLRNKAPLAVEHKFGDGRVVAVLTKASPLETTLGSWNNWGRDNPELRRGHAGDAVVPVRPAAIPTPAAWSARRWTCKLDVAQYLPQVRFVLPRRRRPAARWRSMPRASTEGHARRADRRPTPAASTRPS